VGLAFAQGLGAALGRPVVGVSTLDALADPLATAGVPVAALIDARRGQVYARFRDADGPHGEPDALTLEAASARIAGLASGAVLVGSGAALFTGTGVDIRVLDGPTAEALARLAAAADPALAPARPLYLRAPDATPPTRLPGQARGPVRTP
jgi:tRNA threonylcarbamoyladenosine biosynthesis protein TsaB